MTKRPWWLRTLVEAVVIVASILFAFGIDAAWESRKDDHRRSELIASMTNDFRTSRERLSAAIARGDSLLARSRGFLQMVGCDPLMPSSSLGYLLAGAFRGIHFEPVFSTYLGAVATGDLGLIETPGLIVALTDFQEALGVYQMNETLYDEFFYLGAGVDLRRRVGSQRALEGHDEALLFRMSDAQYWEFARDPSVYGAVATGMILHNQIVHHLRRMDAAAVRVLEELEKIH